MTTEHLEPCGRAACPHDVTGGLVVCGACTALLERALRAVPSLTTELEVTRARLDRVGPDGPIVSSSPTRPLPWSERARAAAEDLFAVLAGWYQVLAPDPAPPCPCACGDLKVGPRCYDAHVWAWDADQRHAAYLPADADTTALAAWLLARTDQAAHHPDGGFLVDDTLEATAAAERAVDAPPPLVYAGRCDYCTGDLYGRLDRATVTCLDRPGFDGCGTVYSAAARRDALLETLRDHTATAAEIAHGVAELAGVKIDRRVLNVWAGRVVDTRTDPRPKLPDRRTAEEFHAGQADPDSGRGLDRVFRIGDVLDLVASAAVAAQQRADRRREHQPAPPPADPWAARMVDGVDLHPRVTGRDATPRAS